MASSSSLSSHLSATAGRAQEQLALRSPAQCSAESSLEEPGVGRDPGRAGCFCPPGEKMVAWMRVTAEEVLKLVGF